MQILISLSCCFYSPGRILLFFLLIGVSSGLRRTIPAVLDRPTTDDSVPPADVLPTDRRGPLCLNLAIFYFIAIEDLKDIKNIHSPSDEKKL